MASLASPGRVESWPGSLEFRELLLQWERKGTENFQKATWAERTKVLQFGALSFNASLFPLLKKEVWAHTGAHLLSYLTRAA